MESDMVQRQVEEIEQHELLQKMVIDTIRKQRCRRVGDVVSILKRLDKSLTLEEIRDAVLDLKGDNKIALSEQYLVGSFSKYIRNLSVNAPFWLTTLVTILSITTVYLTSLTELWSVVRIVVGAAFVLFIPGYSLIQTLFPVKEIDYIERIALSIGLSLATVPLIGLMLNYSPAGIALGPIVVSLSTFSIALAFCGTYRKFLLMQK